MERIIKKQSLIGKIIERIVYCFRFVKVFLALVYDLAKKEKDDDN